VELGNGQPEFVETESHGDHVHIRATDNGQTKVVFSWMHNDRVECSVPEMTINARTGDHNFGFRTATWGLATVLVLQVLAMTSILNLV